MWSIDRVPGGPFMVLSPTERSIRARIGGFALSAAHDPKETTKPGRAAFMASFEEAVDPDGTLTIAERARRAAALKKSHFSRMALASAKARRRRANGS